MSWIRGKLLWILLAAIILLLIVAVVAGVIYVVLREGTSADTSWRDPLQQVLTEQIAPDLALYPLAGAAELDTVDAALASGDLETAYATLVFAMEPSDSQRTGRLILLGDAFAQAQQLDRAALVNEQVFDTTILSPSLNDPMRADALLAAGQGWATIGRQAEALDAYSQVYELALQSPHLQMANRRQLLSLLEAAYGELGETELAQLCREKIIELDQSSNPQPTLLISDSPDMSLGGGTVSSPEVGSLEEARRQAAHTVINVLSAGTEPSPSLTASLAQALRAEDSAKLSLYSQELEGTTQPGRRIDVHWHLIRWLILKYKVATLGFGVSLVPEWETQSADIRSALSKAYEDLFFDYEDLVTALPEASSIGPGSYMTRRQLNLEGRLGHYPNYPADGLAAKLQDAVFALISDGHLDELYVDRTAGGEPLHFFLSPAERYGQAP